MDARIIERIQDPDGLESEILDAEEIQYNAAEKITLIKAVLARPRPLNIQATPFQPLRGEDDRSSREEGPVTNASQEEETRDNDRAIHVERQPEPPTHEQRYASTLTGTSQNVSHLPKLTLPIFEGDPLLWQTFWDSFESAVHSNNVLSEVQKLNYLRAHLGGEALRAIAGFPLTSANYCQSVDLLKDRFGQPQRIVNAHMHALMNLPNPKNEIKSLREFYDAIENHVRGLLALGWTTESYGALLVPMVLGKLPAETRKNLAREHGNLEWTINELRDSIAREIRVLEAGLCVPPSPAEDHLRPPIVTASFHTGATYQLKKPKCIFCKGTHSSIKCDVISDQPKRMEIVKQERLCYNCLGHHKITQCQSKGCCKQCKRWHHTSLCRGNDSQNSPPANRQEKDPNPTSVNTTLLQKSTAIDQPQQGKVCFLKTAVATVRAGNHQSQANILLDEGAQRSFISETLASQLKLTAQGKECVAISAFGASEASNQMLPVTTIFLKTTNGDEIPISVLVIPRISQPLRNLPFSYVKKLPYLQDIRLTHAVSNNQEFDISLLIGADFYWSIVQETVIRGPGPTAVKSKLGYLLSGPLYNCVTSMTSSVLHLSTSGSNTVSSESMWNENAEFECNEHSPSSSSKFLQEYLHNSVTQQPNGTYVVKFPWKPNHPPLPTNKLRRARSLTRKLSRTPEILKIYNSIIEEQLRRGFIEKVPESELVRTSHYIPHHAVHKESATTPVRIVYDCSCREARHLASLNDCLEIGPAFLNDLSIILLRFRSHKFGLTADIEKAFLHVQLDQRDQDFTRFLWPCNLDDPDGPLQTHRFRVVLFGSASSPFMLYAALHHHLTQYNSATASDILQNLYVDNVLSGCSTEDCSLEYYTEARHFV